MIYFCHVVVLFALNEYLYSTTLNHPRVIYFKVSTTIFYFNRNAVSLRRKNRFEALSQQVKKCHLMNDFLSLFSFPMESTDSPLLL